MKEIIRQLFAEENIFLCEGLPFSHCRVISEHKLKRLSFLPTAAIVFAIPYLTTCDGVRNLSRYAVARDYHLYVKELSERLLPKLETIYPEGRFAMFADNSPIDERQAAAMAGLGVLGDNGLILTERYGPYVFIGEILCDLAMDEVGDREAYEVKTCHHCGACSAACPKKEICLSALTQKKGELSFSEINEIYTLGSVWGCDICQEVCPYAEKAETTPIAFFKAELIPYLSLEILDSMSEQEFQKRAYAWRGRNTVRRNILLFDKEAE